ncbi:hypothetical protein I4U23_021421 [Adineta vaga]|nr:hypothetical protein I4U23_021421 [Adineta vaga]
MQTSNTKSDKIEENSSQDLKELTCRLKNAIFSKFISNYLVNKADEMWILYEKRIDKILQDKHFDTTCTYSRSQTATKLEEIVKEHQEAIIACQRDIEILCSSHNKQFETDDKHSIPLQTTINNSNHVPKIPRCIDRLKFNLYL